VKYLCISYFLTLVFLTTVSIADDKKTVSYKEFKSANSQIIQALEKSQKSPLEAANLMQKWNPEDSNLKTYKSFWQASWRNDFSEQKSLYEDFKKQKKHIRLRIELLKDLLDEKTGIYADFLIKESRLILKQMRGTSEGELFESAYLKWLSQNKLYSEICSKERSRWITEPDIDYVEMVSVIEKCPIKFEDFLTRLRRLIFAAKEFQAQREIEIFTKNSNESFKVEDWQKIYIQAIFDSNVGDPVKAFETLTKYEKEILDSDYDDNYFYIAQRAGELKKAEDVIVQIIKNADVKKKKELQFQQGFLFYQTKQYSKAFKIFDQIYKNHPSKNKKRKNKDFDQIAWLRAWVLFLDQKYNESLRAFESTKFFSNDTARLNYWMAMNQLQLGDTTSAQTIFKKLAEPVSDQKSFSFYNILGWLRFQDYKIQYKAQFKNNDVIKNLISITKMPNSQYPAPDDQFTRSQLLQQYNELTNESFTTDEGEIQVVNTENQVLNSDELSGILVGTKTEFQNQIYWAQLLTESGKSDLAKWHLFELEKNIKDRKNSDILAQFYLEHEFYYRALSLQQRFQANSNIVSYKNDPIYWSSVYPETYKKDVTKFSDLRKIDPYLIWSIMRAETQYKADAISPVGAVGLMQFMPYTAQKIAKLLNQQIQSEQLYVPERSIEYGAAYLKKLSIELDYQRPLIAASYNGGPHRVKQWLKNLGQLDYDVFIEHIPFAETRTYTKRVLTYRSMYEKIYSGQLNYDKMKYLIEKIPFAAPEKFKLSEEWDVDLSAKSKR
jgi:soluble lytic murein transglycosylase